MEKISVRQFNRICVGIIFVVIFAFVSEEFIPERLFLQKVFLVIIAGIGFFALIYKNNYKVAKAKKIYEILFCFVWPFLIFLIYTILICTMRNDQIETAKQAITTTMFMVVLFFVEASLTKVFKEKTIDLLSISLIASYCYIVLLEINNIGFKDAFKELITQEIERNDIGVAAVPLLLFYLFNVIMRYRKREINKIIIVCLLLLIMWFCGKRSALLGFGIGLLIIVSLKVLKRNEKKFIYFCLGLAFFISFLYVISIRCSLLDNIITGANTLNDRYHVWKSFNSMYDISPLYIGKGVNFVHKFMEAGLGDKMVNAYGYLHNSILQIYIETGFFGFFIWMAFYLVIIPYKTLKNINKTAFSFVAISIMSMLVIFTVDNVLTYPIYQICLQSSIFAICYKNMEIKRTIKTRRIY